MGGPGQRQIELDRRLIDQRIVRINRELKDVRRTRKLHRHSRKRVPYPIVALVGYTNAGKSTLFNRLTNSNVVAKDQLFATLDPTMRSIHLPNAVKTVLSDTVGFISSIPHELVKAFQATLEEVIEADLIVHVRDISHPDTEIQKRDVEEVLRQLGIDGPAQERIIEVQNKIDLLDGAIRRAKNRRAHHRKNTQVIPISAVTGEGIHAFLDLLSDRLAEDFVILDINIDHSDGRTLAWLYQNGEVVKRQDTNEQIFVSVRLSPLHAARFQRYV